jgi:2-keto-4-pentenoate hydratase/2-oxohepta-3-ene-1,7-dioic acid hydratase in catechol pathway
MKLLSFLRNGKPTWGAMVDGGAVDLATPSLPTLKAAIAAGALGTLAAQVAGRKPDVAAADLKYLPVIPDPGKIVCVGLNYEEHRLETKRDKTENPALFLRVADSQIGHGEPILRPRESTHLDYEGEIAIIIGKGGRRIAEKDAWNHIVGYSAYNDGSVRDWQRHTVQWTAGKNFHATGGFGPWMVTADEFTPGEILTLETRLNGQVMQHATTDMLIFSIPEQIAYISTFTTLEPGDVIVTGTPGGVGARRDPPVWMKPGDTVEIEVSKVGVLKNPIAQD